MLTSWLRTPWFYSAALVGLYLFFSGAGGATARHAQQAVLSSPFGATAVCASALGTCIPEPQDDCIIGGIDKPDKCDDTTPSCGI